MKKFVIIGCVAVIAFVAGTFASASLQPNRAEAQENQPIVAPAEIVSEVPTEVVTNVVEAPDMTGTPAPAREVQTLTQPAVQATPAVQTRVVNPHDSHDCYALNCFGQNPHANHDCYALNCYGNNPHASHDCYQLNCYGQNPHASHDCAALNCFGTQTPAPAPTQGYSNGHHAERGHGGGHH